MPLLQEWPIEFDFRGNGDMRFPCPNPDCGRHVVVPRSKYLGVLESFAIGSRRIRCAGCTVVWQFDMEDGSLHASGMLYD